MKIDLYRWREVKPNETFQAPKGRLHVMCSETANLYVSAFGHEVLAGFGQEIDVQTTETVTAIVEASPDARVFIERPMAINHVSDTEVFTNADRLPTESGSLLEVSKALRAFKLEQREIRDEMRLEHFELLRQRKKLVPKTDLRPEEIPDEDQEPDADDQEATE